ncbi:MAG: pectate lyase [Pedobacter sp.]|uniref:pectate lyase n=1 Tax=Pedobacter sp. TaxID=1411316 RepID=UPI0035698468
MMNSATIIKLLMISTMAFTSCEKQEKFAGPGIYIDPTLKPEEPGQVTENALAFPGVEGYGKAASGGRGGKVIKVTNLNDAGVGSLRAAIEATGARIIVFEISGNIKLSRRLQIKNGDITIAGQTAPGDGICIQDYEMNIDADNVIIRFMRFRMGDLTENEQDALWGRYHQNIVIDHCSMSWSIDECSSFYANKNFTMQWCILSESLNKSFHGKDDHGYGAIWGGSNVTFHHNLLAHHNSRNARFDGGHRTGTGSSPFGIDKVDYRNNVIYNWGGNSAYGGENGEYNLVANYYKPGPGTASNRRSRIMEISMEADLTKYGPGFGKFYASGNYVDGNATVTADNWSGGMDKGTGLGDANYALAKMTNPFVSESITAHTALQAYNAVLLYGGASHKRDAVDTRILKELKDGTATYNGSKTGKRGIIDSQTDVGGWPVLNATAPLIDTDGDGMPDSWEVEKGLNPKVADANGHDLSTGYTNIEVYINGLVKNITDNQYKL